MEKTNRGLLKLVIMASGEGTNAMNLIEFFRKSGTAEVVMILTNNPGAGIISRAKKADVRCEVIGKEVYNSGEALALLLKKLQAEVVVLAGYLKLIPGKVIEMFRDRIINIHPSLLPKFGGKGMFGAQVHQAVLAAGETESGITIHLVDEEYDRGKILFQEKLSIQPGWTAEKLQQEIHQLEYRHFPIQVEKYLGQMKSPTRNDG